MNHFNDGKTGPRNARRSGVNPRDVSDALIEQAARTVSKVGESAVNLPEVAALAGIDEEVARGHYPDTPALLDALNRYVNSRFEAFVNEELSQLPADSTAMEKVQAVARGYFTFSQTEKRNFGAFIGLSTTNHYGGFDADFAQLSNRPSFQLIMSLTREAIIEAGGPRDEWLLVVSAASLFAAMHGFSHLSTFGITRYLSDAAKKQTLNSVMHTIIAGVQPALKEGITQLMVPTNYVGPTDFAAPPRAVEMAQGTDEEKRKALWRAAIEQSSAAGLHSVTLARAANRAGIDLSEAMRLLDSDDRLLSTLETHLDEADQGMIGAQCFMVKEGSAALSYIKAIGYGYVGYALSDPAGFTTLIAVSSGSIVPASFEVNYELSDMGVAFGFLMDITRQAIEEGGGPRSAWELYAQIFSLWSTAHGLAHLFSCGALRHLDNEEKFKLLGPVLDLIGQGMVNALNLDIPHLEFEDVTDEHRFHFGKSRTAQ